MPSRRTVLTSIGAGLLTSTTATTTVADGPKVKSDDGGFKWNAILEEDGNGWFDGVTMIDGDPLFLGRAGSDGWAIRPGETGVQKWVLRASNPHFKSALPTEDGILVGAGRVMYEFVDGEVEEEYDNNVTCSDMARFPDGSIAAAHTYRPTYAFQVQLERYDLDQKESAWVKFFPGDLHKQSHFQKLRGTADGVEFWYRARSSLEYRHIDVSGDILDEWSFPYESGLDLREVGVGPDDETILVMNNMDEPTITVIGIVDGSPTWRESLYTPEDFYTSAMTITDEEIVVAGKVLHSREIYEIRLPVTGGEPTWFRYHMEANVRIEAITAADDGTVFYAGGTRADRGSRYPWYAASDGESRSIMPPTPTPTPTETPTETPSPTPTETTTPTEPHMSTPASTETSAGETAPGLGAVSGIVGVLGGAAVARHWFSEDQYLDEDQ